ncbi:Senp1 mutant in complex with sumo-1 [Absidia repens]|uniref:Senp1 mutant in complex with sumo-1 n=1 Tax=Absidia repens TaxID=90262 RepID=A0A1X2I4N3_9FUNG|nr:Senp1 mutant in complex with sumo-1 [Absidia repens]
MVEFKDVNKLLPETWLNDEIINFYMVLLMDRATSSTSDSLPSVHCYNTFFCSTLRDQGYDKVKRWTKKVDIFSKRLLLIPINRSYHWTLGVIDLAKKQVLLFLQYLEWEHMDKKKIAYDTSDWQTVMPSDIPQQQNSSDCGVFACTFAERLARNHEFDFGQNDMVSIRRRMVLDIMRKKLSI